MLEKRQIPHNPPLQRGKRAMRVGGFFATIFTNCPSVLVSESKKFDAEINSARLSRI